MSENEKDHERIWLEPMVLDGGYGPEGRCWSHDNPWPEDQGDMPATEYVRADLLTAAEARIKMLTEALGPFADFQACGKADVYRARAVLGWAPDDPRDERALTHGSGDAG